MTQTPNADYVICAICGAPVDDDGCIWVLRTPAQDRAHEAAQIDSFGTTDNKVQA